MPVTRRKSRPPQILTPLSSAAHAGSTLEPEQQTAVLDALNARESMSSIAKRLRISRDKVRTIAEYAGIVDRLPSRGGSGQNDRYEPLRAALQPHTCTCGLPVRAHHPDGWTPPVQPVRERPPVHLPETATDLIARQRAETLARIEQRK